MFDIGWAELLMVATVAILVVGPKDLPGMLRSFGKTFGNLKRMANEFQGQFSDALREAETHAGLDDAKNSMADLHKINPLKDFKDSINPLKDIGKDINSSLNSEVKPDSSTPADSVSESEAPLPTEQPDAVAAASNAADDASEAASSDNGQKADKA